MGARNYHKTNRPMTTIRTTLVIAGNAALVVGNLLVTAALAATPVTPRFDVFEVELAGTKSYANPFLDVTVAAEFTGPSGRKVTAHGFHDGSNVWRVRFAPDETGAWNYVTTASDTNNAGLHQRTGSLTCAASAHRGFIRIHPDNPYAFAYTDGTPFFPMGDTCYGLFDDSHITPALRREYLETRRRQRFNFVRMTMGHSEARAAKDPAFWAWGGTPAQPDLDRFNPTFFRGLDELFRDLQARGMNVELILFNCFQGTVGQSDIWNRIDAPNRYSFAVQDAGAAPQLGMLYDFFAALPFWRMQPFEGVSDGEAVALAEPGTVYVLCLPHGGKVTVDLTAAKGTLSGHWFNPRDGTAGEPFEVAHGRSDEFQAPTTADWVLLLRSGLNAFFKKLSAAVEPAALRAAGDQAGRASPTPGTSAQPTSDPSAVAGLILGIDGTVFTLNGKKTFLLGASYYGALGAPDDFIARDFDDLRALGFNWIRVFAVWDIFDHNVSAVDRTGKAREPYISKLKAVVTAAEKRGLVVDVTLSRMPCLSNQEAHLRAVETLAKALKGCRNVYFDLANERDQNYAGGTFVSAAEVKALRDRAKAADPDRLVTASGEPKDRTDLARYLVETGLDFISPHLSRDAGTEQRTADATRKFLGWMKELGRAAPIHYQEPFRRDYLDYRGYWQPEAETFCTDLRNAKRGGAAGWCFHNGSPSPPERFPAGNRRSFDLRRSQGRLMDQLDEVERQFLKRAASCAQ